MHHELFINVTITKRFKSTTKHAAQACLQQNFYCACVITIITNAMNNDNNVTCGDVIMTLHHQAWYTCNPFL